MILPVYNPVRVSSPYGWRTLRGKRQFHDGIDFVSDSGRAEVFAVSDGRIVYDQDDYDHELRWRDKHHSAGNMIIQRIVIEGEIYYARYLHLIENRIDKGENVAEGRVLGVYGDVGYSFGAHLHFDLYDQGWKKIDPTWIFRGMI
jgi:Membrane proteins related to metalloendopeptidases